MKRLGEFLREKRQAQGISLEQISADTRISLDMLKAIEDGNVKQLPPPVFIKGFLRAYAEKIGLDPEEVIVEYQDLIEETNTHREAMEKFNQRLHPKSSRKKVFVLLTVLGLLAGLTFISYRYSHVRKESATSADVEPGSSSLEKRRVSSGDFGSGLNRKQAASVSRKIDAKPGPRSEPEISEPKAESSAVVSSTPTPFVLRAKAMETTWLHIIIDESREREYMLQPGEQLTWMAASGINLLVGNAGGIQLYLNDEPLKPLGASGKVVRLQLPDPSLIAITDFEQIDSGNRQ